MRLHIPRSFWNSIRFKQVIVVLILLIPFFLLLAYNNFYAINTVRDQVAVTNKNVVSLYLNQIDSNLGDVNKYLADLLVLNTDLAIIGSGSDEMESTLAVMRMSNKLNKDIPMYKYADMFFIYSAQKQQFIYASNGRTGVAETEKVNNYVKNMIKENSELNALFNKEWYVRKIGENFYLIHILKSGNVYVGTWIKTASLLVPLNESHFSGSVSLFITEQGEPMNDAWLAEENRLDLSRNLQQYYLTGAPHKYLVVGVKSEEGNFSLAAVTPDEDILSAFPYIQRVVVFFAGVTAVFLSVYLLTFRKMVLVPLKRLLSAMKRIRKGNLETRIDMNRTSEEFLILNETFNDMITQINKLKIDIYEEKINRQKAELEHLQLQVKPHFFLNSLNIMNTLARTKNYGLLQEMCTCLIQYFRYVFRSNMDFVPIRDELDHVRNYIRIQELRFPRSLSAGIEAPEFLLGTKVPPLLIHTFVENTVKHSVTLDDPVRLSIRIYIDETGAEPMVKIVTGDTGKGFDGEILRKLREGRKIVDERGEHIGIFNAQKRLQYLYQGRATIRFSNCEPHGAVVEIGLPLDLADMNGGDSNAAADSR